MNKGELIVGLYPMVVAVISIVVIALLREPTIGVYLAAGVSLVGFLLLSFAKWSVIRGGKLFSFGYSQMSTFYARCYKIGFILLTLGALAVLLLAAFMEVNSGQIHMPSRQVR